MIYPNADKLENWGSKYSLVILAAKRAKQLKQGAKPLIKTNSVNPLTIALEEIAADAIKCSVPDTDAPAVTHEEPETATLLTTLPEPDSEAEHTGTSEELGEAVLVDDEDHEEPTSADEHEEEDYLDHEEEEEEPLHEDEFDAIPLLGVDEDEEDVVGVSGSDEELEDVLLADDIAPKPRKKGRKPLEDDDIGADLEPEEIFDEPIEVIDEEDLED